MIIPKGNFIGYKFILYTKVLKESGDFSKFNFLRSVKKISSETLEKNIMAYRKHCEVKTWHKSHHQKKSRTFLEMKKL